ncbi:MAG: flagellar basal body rod protein FlgC [candidate division Zixibacteria bacterium]|nr:flagellar basal body rod protein FlgC [candidate division Zixibacteria bacterium]
MSIESLRVFEIAADGLSAQRLKMDTVSENIANAETTRTPEGGPYRRQDVSMAANNTQTEFRSQLQLANMRLRQTRDGHNTALRPNRAILPGAESAVTANVQEAPPEQVKLVFDPSHPDADDSGYVAMPDVELIVEMVEMMAASRAYEANLTTIDATKQMIDKALEI